MRFRIGFLALLTMVAVPADLVAIVQDPPAEIDPPAETAPPADPRDAELEKLGEKLIRKVIDDSEEDVMSAMIRLMDESARRLEIDFDPGEETQAVQRKALEELESAIKQAASRRRKGAPQDQQSSADRRRKSSNPQPGGGSQKEGEGKQGAGQQDGESESATQLTEAAKSGGEMKESRRAWGNLPPRERDEVIQGAEENSLQRYRQWIERYYRALQESGE